MNLNPVNDTVPSVARDRVITWDDATWILTSSFVIFTMQSGKSFLHLHVINKAA
jgi:hypothetical protein